MLHLLASVPSRLDVVHVLLLHAGGFFSGWEEPEPHEQDDEATDDLTLGCPKRISACCRSFASLMNMLLSCHS